LLFLSTMADSGEHFDITLTAKASVLPYTQDGIKSRYNTKRTDGNAPATECWSMAAMSGAWYRQEQRHLEI